MVTDPTCTEQGYTTHTCTRCGDSYVDTYVDALGHKWKFAEFTWTENDEDGCTATANYKCGNDESHTETVEATVFDTVVTEATCTDNGQKKYTAVVSETDSLDGEAHTANRTATIEALGHKYELSGWTWAEDYSTATAKFTCKNDETHVENVEAVVTSIPGIAKITYTATATFEGETYTDEKVVKLDVSNIVSNSVNFEAKLELRTYIVLSEEIKADADAFVRVTFNGETTDHKVSDLLQNLNDGRAVVKQEVFAAMMRDEMTLQLFNGAGEVQPLTYKETEDVTDGFVYTVLDYLKDRQENSTNPEMVELARAAELYGIAAQVYFEYKPEQLTEGDLAKLAAEVGETVIPSSCAEELTGTLPEGITKRTKTVMFESDNALRQYFYTSAKNIGKYTFTLDGEAATPVKHANGKYYIEMPNIASGLLSKAYTFTVTDGTDTYTIKSSALGYAYDRQENSSIPAMVDLSKMLYVYSQAADAYFA